MFSDRAKRLVRQTIGLPVVSDGLRWFLHQESVPPRVRSFAHRKLAKAALFGPRTFKYRTADGATLELAHKGAANYLYWLGRYEPETLAVFTQLARDASVIFDIGAAEGVYALLAAATNPAARIFAFEPFAGAADNVERNFALNAAVTKNASLHRVALGAEDGTATLYVASESGGNSSLNPAFRSTHGEQRTEVCRGDSFMTAHHIDGLDLMKVDTESTEPAVLRGFGDMLARHRPEIVCEVLPGRTEAELDAILRPLGYRFFAITAAGLELRTAIAGDHRFVNYLFTTAADDHIRKRGLPLARS